MSLPTRVDNHRTETRAVRRIIGTISEDWLIRNMDERDYGIDLMFEVFNERFPTGRIAFVQSKGTEAAFHNNGESIVLNKFPVKTVEYALRLTAPFFIFYTSLQSNQTVFVWLQQYARTKLIESKNWQKNETVTIYFPPDNSLTNITKIETILHSEQVIYQTIEFLRNTRWLKIHIGSILGGEYDVAKSALKDLEAIFRCNAFLEIIIKSPNLLDLGLVKVSLVSVINSRCVSEENVRVLNEFQTQIEELEGLILDKNDIEHFEASMTGNSPQY